MRSEQVLYAITAELMLESASAAIPVLQQLDAAARTELIAGVQPEIVARIRAYTVDAELRFPTHTHLARANRYVRVVATAERRWIRRRRSDQ